MQATRIFETCLYTHDLAAAEAFYRDVLGLEFVLRMDGDRGLAFRCGPGMLLIFDSRQCSEPYGDIPAHGSVGAGHVAFPVEARDLDAWRTHLRKCQVPIETEVTWPNGGVSVYFRDPAGNSLELAPPTLWNL